MGTVVLLLAVVPGKVVLAVPVAVVVEGVV
jgi:hypothetical protein